MSKNTMTMVVVVGLLVVALATIDAQNGKIADLTQDGRLKDDQIRGLRRDLANATATVRDREADLRKANERIAELAKAAGRAAA